MCNPDLQSHLPPSLRLPHLTHDKRVHIAWNPISIYPVYSVLCPSEPGTVFSTLASSHASQGCF